MPSRPPPQPGVAEDARTRTHGGRVPARSMLEVQSLSRRFGMRTALDRVTLTAEAGEILAFLGPNGAGKTTLLKVVSTLVAPSSGSVRLDGFDVEEEPEEVRRRIGCMFHDLMLYNDLTVHENLQFFRRLHNSSPADGRLDGLLDRVGLLHRKTDRVATLSRGMKQRVALARAMLNHPKVLLLDEPFTGLDEAAAETLQSFVWEFAASSGVVLLSSHNPRQAQALATRLLILVRGRIVTESRSDDVTGESFARQYRQQMGAST